MRSIPREDVPVVIDDNGAGEAFYWAPGHAPEALEDSEYVDFSPTEEFRRVVGHISSRAGASA